MSTPRQTAHRPRRQGRKSRELADLKRTQHQLQNEARRLQEALARVERPRVVKVVGEPAPKAPGPGEKCPVCGDATREVDLGRFKMVACPSCKWHVKRA